MMFPKKQRLSQDTTHNVSSTLPEKQIEPTRAPASALNAIMGKLGLAREANEPEADTTDLARALKDPAWEVRVEAVQKLGKMGKQAPLELLLVALSDAQCNVRVAAARALSRNPRPATVSALVSALEDEAWIVRVEVVRALGKLPEDAPLEPLLLAAEDDNPIIRAAALRAMGEFHGSFVLETLSTALQDEDWSVREAAALTLGQLGEQATIPALLHARRDSDASVRLAAEEGLRSLNPALLSSPPRSDSFVQWLARTDYSGKQEPRPAYIEQLPSGRFASFRWKIEQTAEALIHILHRQKRYQNLTSSSHRKQRFEDLAGGLLAAFLMVGLFASWLIIATWPRTTTLDRHPASTFTTYRGHTSSVSQLAWSPSGLSIASADIRGTVQIWQAGTGQQFLSYPHEGEVLALVWENPTVLQVAYAEPNKELQVYMLNIGPGPRYEMLLERTRLPGIPQAAAWSSDGHLLAFDTGNGNIQIWDTTTRLLVSTLHNKPTQYSQLSWSPDNNLLESINMAGHLQIWDVWTGSNFVSLTVTQQISIATWIVYSKPMLCMILITTDGEILKWVPANGPNAYVPLIQESTYNLEGSSNLTVEALAVSPDSSQIIMATSDGLVQARDSTTMNLVDVYTGHSAQVNDVEWSPDGHYIATGSADMTVQIWQEP